MKLIDRYFGIEFLKVYIFAIISFTILFLIISLLDDIIRIETQEDPVHIYLYILFSIPEILFLIIPAALLFGVCFSVSQFTVSRELIAIQSAGVSFYRAIIAVFITGVFTSIFLFAFQNFIVTPSKEKALNELAILKKNTGVAKNLIWQKNIKGKKGYYFLYYLDKNSLKIIGGFNYLEFNKNKPIRMYQAKEAKYNKKTKDWLLKKAILLTFDDDLKVSGVLHYDTIRLILPDDISFFTNPFRDPLELNLLELIDEINRRKSMSFSTVRYEVQFHSNIAYPLMCIILSIVGSIVGGMGSLRSSGPLVRSILISVSTMLLYILAFSLGKNLGNSEVVSPALAGWGPTVFFFLISIGLLFYNKK